MLVTLQLLRRVTSKYYLKEGNAMDIDVLIFVLMKKNNTPTF